MITLPLDITRYPNIGYPKYNFILSKVIYKKKFVYEWFRFPARNNIQLITNDVTQRCFSFWFI